MPFRKLGEPFAKLATPIGSPRGGGAVAFVPTDIAGLFVWTDLNDIATLFTDSAGLTPVAADDDVIGRAEDKSGNGNHVIQPGADAIKPVFKTAIQNGRSVARFSIAAGTFLQRTYAATLAQPRSVYVTAVYTNALPLANSFLWDGINGAARSAFFLAVGDKEWDGFSGAVLTTSIVADANWHRFNTQDNGASGVVEVDATSVSGNIGAQDMDGLTLGAGQALNAFLGGDIGEVLIYDNILSAADDAAVKNYLAGWL